MECKKCGAAWTAKTNVAACPFCGADLKPSEFKDVVDVLKYIIKNFGADTFLTPKILISYLSDLAPTLTDERNLLGFCAELNLFAELYNVHNSENAQKDLMCVTCSAKLQEKHYMHKEIADKAVFWIASALEWDIKALTVFDYYKAAQPKPAPVQQQPKPARQQPAPVQSQPKPAQQQPKPAKTQQAPARQQTGSAPLSMKTNDFDIQNGVLVKYKGSAADVVIPNSVTSIGEEAFRGCKKLTSVTIPNSVTSIGDSAFFVCTGLTSITIPNSVTSIESWAFYGCYGLTAITIPNSVTSIGEEAFRGCKKLTSVTIPSSVTSIGDKAFGGCKKLTSVTIPNSVTSIGSGIFGGCELLESINVSADNQACTLENGVLFNKGKTELICFPGGKTGDYIIPNSVTSIGKSAFFGCKGLTSVTIPSSVKSIGNSAFSNCTGLTSVTIPESVTSIGECAFFGCKGLTSITIPDSVTSIGMWAFDGCKKLTSISVSDETANRLGITRLLRPQRIKLGVCTYCGGKFTLFSDKCKKCGKKKDY